MVRVQVQLALYRPTDAGLDEIEVIDAAGVRIVIPITSSEPQRQERQSVAITPSGPVTLWSAASAGTPQGVDDLLRLATEEAGSQNQLVIGAWDAAIQEYVDLPTEPAGGLTPFHGLFIATRYPRASRGRQVVLVMIYQ